jgi:hypothetical protein
LNGGDSLPHREIAAAKLNLALHVRNKLPDGRHAIETIFAFCTDGDRLSARPADGLSLEIVGPSRSSLATDRTIWSCEPRKSLRRPLEWPPARPSGSTKGCRSRLALAVVRPMPRRRFAC